MAYVWLDLISPDTDWVHDMITQAELRARFFYHPDGWLYHRDTMEIVGYFNGPYVRVSIDSCKFYLHQLVFLWHHGYIPNYIDHIDRDGINNRIENLRECDQSQNSGNSRQASMRGIQKHGRKWRVRISTCDGKIELGSYESLNEAIEARDAGYREYFGEFYA